MRKVIANEWMTPDGVVQAPSYPDEDVTGGFRHAANHRQPRPRPAAITGRSVMGRNLRCPQRTERGAELRCEQLRLLPGSEVTAPFRLSEVAAVLRCARAVYYAAADHGDSGRPRSSTSSSSAPGDIA
jgi:hypothetical protein